MSEIWDLYNRDRIPLNKTMTRDPYIPVPGEYHIVVHAWIQNSNGEWLLSQRTANKKFPLLWECTGGSVIAGEDSLDGAVREIKEELGIDVDKNTGKLFKTIIRDEYLDICDVWVFKHDCDISEIKLQPDETCNAMWASVDKVYELINQGNFVPREHMSYINNLFEVFKMENETNSTPKQELLNLIRKKVPGSAFDMVEGVLMPYINGLSDSDCENMKKIIEEKGLAGALFMGKKMKKKIEKDGESLTKGMVENGVSDEGSRKEDGNTEN